MQAMIALVNAIPLFSKIVIGLFFIAMIWVLRLPKKSKEGLETCDTKTWFFVYFILIGPLICIAPIVLASASSEIVAISKDMWINVVVFIIALIVPFEIYRARQEKKPILTFLFNIFVWILMLAPGGGIYVSTSKIIPKINNSRSLSFNQVMRFLIYLAIVIIFMLTIMYAIHMVVINTERHLQLKH